MKAGVSVLNYMTVLYESWCSKSSGNFLLVHVVMTRMAATSPNRTRCVLGAAGSCRFRCFFCVYNILMYGIFNKFLGRRGNGMTEERHRFLEILFLCDGWKHKFCCRRELSFILFVED